MYIVFSNVEGFFEVMYMVFSTVGEIISSEEGYLKRFLFPSIVLNILQSTEWFLSIVLIVSLHSTEHPPMY